MKRPGLLRPIRPIRPIPLALAALATLLLAGVCLAGIAQTVTMPTEEDLVDRGFRYMGENFADKFDELPGMETRIRVFARGQEKIGLYLLPNLEIYAFARMGHQMPIQGFVDEDNDDYCETTIQETEDFVIDFKAYGITPPKRNDS